MISILYLMGIAWAIAYLLIIRRTHLDRVPAIPLIAVCANMSWEFLFAFAFPEPWGIVAFIWLMLDAIILAQFFLYGSKPERSKRALIVLCCIPLFLALISYDHAFGAGLIGDAIAQNLLMSFLFIFLVLRREGIAGMSVWIGIAKGIGTAAGIVQFALVVEEHAWYPVIALAYALIAMLDALYIALVWRRVSRAGINPLLYA